MQPPSESNQATASPARESLIFFAHLLAALLLLAACYGVPFLVAHVVHPWCGPASCVPSFWLWRRFGPPPGPSMLAGFLCIQGCIAILGTGIAMLLLVVMKFFE